MKLPCTSSVADEKGVLQKLIISVLPLGPTRKVLIFLVNLKNTSVFFFMAFYQSSGGYYKHETIARGETRARAGGFVFFSC